MWDIGTNSRLSCGEVIVTQTVETIEQQPPQRLNRTLYTLILASFFFPFATVRSCAGDEGVSHTGIALLREDTGVLLVGVLVLAALMLMFSFRNRVLETFRQGLLSASKAMLCALAVLTTLFATGVPFLFSQVSVQIGFYLCVGSWLVLFLLSMHMATQLYLLVRSECREQPPPWGLAIGIVVAVADLLTVWLSRPNDFEEVTFGVGASVLLAAPIILVAMLLAVRYRMARMEAPSSGYGAE